MRTFELLDGPLLGFRHFWGQYVSGFDHSQHCLKCLIGERDHRFHPAMMPGVLTVPDPLAYQSEYDFFYVCGVAAPWSHRDNFHAALRPVDDHDAALTLPTWRGQTIKLHGFELIPIPPLRNGWNGLGREFTTCRNFQFAVSQYGYPA